MNKYIKGIAFLYTACCTTTIAAQEEVKERPNFVWFMAEDVTSYYLKLYNNNEKGVATPHVEKLAKEGIVFNNAYSNAPVSSAARSTLITGCYAPRLGVSFHRKLEQVPMPEGLRMFPSYLREAGYHTSNAAKTDYNCFMDKTAWDVVNGELGEWRNRPNKKTPFFHVRTSMTTHESKLQFKENKVNTVKTKNDPNDVFVHPNHPDTKLFRYTYATFYDRIQDSDNELGELMEMLKADGELDNTFIFYFGDNGGSLPFSKGYTTETGLHVPMVVYVPKKWRERLPIKIGERTNGFVSFMDLGPTLLHLAGISVPEGMDGTPFLGEDISKAQMEAKDEVYGYGERFDELYAFNRTLRKGNFKYSRNFQPYHSKSLYSLYRYKQAAFREWKKMYNNGKLNKVQSYFFEPQGAEELYDLSLDPYETKNLAGDPTYQSKLKELRALLKKQMVDKHDLGLYPECVWLEQGKTNPTQFGLTNSNSIKRYSDIADLEMETFNKAKNALTKALQSNDPVERYWGATVCASFSKEATVLHEELKKMTNDPKAYVRSRAIVALSLTKKMRPEVAMKATLKKAQNKAESLLILNDMAFLKEAIKGCNFRLTEEDVCHKGGEINWRIKYLQD
jgi:arylsulfatase A-like enzyme